MDGPRRPGSVSSWSSEQSDITRDRSRSPRYPRTPPGPMNWNGITTVPARTQDYDTESTVYYPSPPSSPTRRTAARHDDAASTISISSSISSSSSASSSAITDEFFQQRRFGLAREYPALSEDHVLRHDIEGHEHVVQQEHRYEETWGSLQAMMARSTSKGPVRDF